MKFEQRDVLLFILVVLIALSVAHDFFGEEERPEVVYVGGHSPEVSPRLGDPRWSGWITVPPGFRRVQMAGRTSDAAVNAMDILEGRYQVNVGLGEFTDPADGEVDFFTIDVLRPSKDSSQLVVGGLHFPLAFVSEDRLRAPAERVVSVDPVAQVITYDLGKSVFKFQLPTE